MSARNLLLSPEQAVAVSDIINWYQTDRRKQVFSVSGYAGTGKSTIIKYAIEALGLTELNVRYLTFTGKASLVLQNKGNPAQTIHSFVYVPKIVEYRCPRTGLKKSKITGFDLRGVIDEEIKLLVLDEASMISQQLLKDILSFRVKVLALGDPGQLPPVKGAGNSLFAKPDVLLEHIHRQAQGSAIIWAATRARQGLTIPYGTHGGNVHVIRRNQITTEMLLRANQVITCQHYSRIKYNNQVRDYLGLTGELPQVGEKLICLKNNWHVLSSRTQTPLINGLTGVVHNPVKKIRRPMREFDLDLEIEQSPGDLYMELTANLDFFEPKAGIKPDTEGRMDHFDFGTAITAHKAQGSEWRRVLCVDDVFGGEAVARQLRYTKYTRAVEELTIAL